MRIAGTTSDYTMLGTNDIDGASNTRIILSGATRTGDEGRIGYVACSTGSHVFYTGGTDEKMRINSNGYTLEVASGTGNTGAISASYFGPGGQSVTSATGTFTNVTMKINGTI